MSNPDEPAAATKAPTLWLGVPPHNPHFTGREELLLALRSQLGAGFTTALVPITLYGMGGVGKSQIAIEYIYRFAADYELVCWISGQVPSQLRSGLAALAPHLGISASADGDQEATLEAVKEALRLGEPYQSLVAGHRQCGATRRGHALPPSNRRAPADHIAQPGVG